MDIKYYYWIPNDYSPTYLFTVRHGEIDLIGIHNTPLGYGTDGLKEPEDIYIKYLKTHIRDNGIDVPYRREVSREVFERYLLHNK